MSSMLSPSLTNTTKCLILLSLYVGRNLILKSEAVPVFHDLKLQVSMSRVCFSLYFIYYLYHFFFSSQIIHIYILSFFICCIVLKAVFFHNFRMYLGKKKKKVFRKYSN